MHQDRKIRYRSALGLPKVYALVVLGGVESVRLTDLVVVSCQDLRLNLDFISCHRESFDRAGSVTTDRAVASIELDAGVMRLFLATKSCTVFQSNECASRISGDIRSHLDSMSAVISGM